MRKNVRTWVVPLPGFYMSGWWVSIKGYLVASGFSVDDEVEIDKRERNRIPDIVGCVMTFRVQPVM